MKLTTTQLRRIIAEEVKKSLKEATRDSYNMVSDLEDMAIGETFGIELHTDSGVVAAEVSLVPAPPGTMVYDPEENEEVDVAGVYTLTIFNDEDGGEPVEPLEFTHPSELVDYIESEGWAFSY